MLTSALSRRLVVAVALAGSTGLAQADGVGVIAAGNRDDRAALAGALAEAIGARARGGDAVAEARDQLAAGAVSLATLAQFRRVRELIDDGWGAYLRVQIDVAHSRLIAARGEAEPLVALPGGAELYADAALRLGAVLLHRKSPDAAAVFALAIALDPARPITLAEFSPDVVEAVAAVRSAPRVVQRLRVTTAPPGAVISVDGVPLGPAPLDVEVPRGQHLVVARAPQHRAAVHGVRVEGGAAAVELALDRDDAAVALAGGAEPGLAAPAEQALVDATLAHAELDEALLAAIVDRRGGQALAVQRCAGAPARCTAAVEIGFGDRAGLAAAAREAWEAVRSGELRDAPSVVGASQRTLPPSGCRWCRSPLVWTGVGAVVVGVVIAVVVASGDRPPPVVIVNGPDFGR